MAGRLNKKVLCFVDEYGTAGKETLHLGAVLVFAREAGRLDKRFSDLLEPSANEIHAVELQDGYLQGLLHKFWAAVPRERVVMLNQKFAAQGGEAPVLYAQAVIEIVKIGLKRFCTVLDCSTINNVDIITDVNQHNDHPLFMKELERAQQDDGRFRGVNRIALIDSAASRLLQLADVVAHSRKWVVAGERNAQGLRDNYGIELF